MILATMTPNAKASAARCGLALGALGFLLGSVLLCNCPGLFICASAAAALPTIWGWRIVRIAGICLCIASVVAAAMQFQKERDRATRTKQIHKAVQPDGLQG
jgi:hypothetical protein